MGFSAVDPDVLDEQAAYGPEPVESADDRAERLARAFEGGATLNLNAPPIEGATGDDTTPDGEPVKRRRRRRSATGKDTAIGGTQLGGLFVAGFTLVIGFTVGDWATPTPDEANAIAKPLGNILARRIDLESKLGKDTDDVVLLAIAMMAYTARIGPIAAGRASSAWEQRNQRRNVTRVDGPPEPLIRPDGGRTGGVAVGSHDIPRSPLGATHSPVDAITAASERGLGYLDRNLNSGT